MENITSEQLINFAKGDKRSDFPIPEEVADVAGACQKCPHRENFA